MVGYQALEDKIERIFKRNEGKEIPLSKELMNRLGLSSTKISRVDSSISKHHNAKTDLLVVFDDGKKLKISIKKDNAHYYGNWYTHQRILKEFGKVALQKLVNKTTFWANEWIKQPSSSFFLGVSINFGERSGNTYINFNEVFTNYDIRTIVQGHTLSLDTSANVLLQTEGSNINTIEDITSKLKIFDDALLRTLFNKVKIVFRPINPTTEGSNRGKQTYTKFVPNRRFETETLLNSKSDLLKYGKFEPINLNTEYRLNHNRIIKMLKKDYNVKINVK
jgi:hypothetical protein